MIIINQPLTTHQASRETCVLANKYQFIYVHPSAGYYLVLNWIIAYELI